MCVYSSSPLNLPPISSLKAFPTVDSQDAKFVIALGNVCSVTERLPTSAVLSAGLKKRDNIAEDSGGTGDVWRGEYRGTQVAIKAFRIHPASKLKEAKEVCVQSAWEVRSQLSFQILWKRVPMWRRLSHENILVFRGVDTTLFELALVYDWEQHGNIIQYLSLHPEASRPRLVCKIPVITTATNR